MKTEPNRYLVWMRLVRIAFLSSVFLIPGWAQAQVNISQVPLFLTSSADPNIMFTLDDSGSMHWEITPDDFTWSYYMFPRAAGNYGAGDYENFVVSFRDDATADNGSEQATAALQRSSRFNRSYYNPANTYRPWAKPAGMAIAATPPVATAASSFPNASPTAAPNHPIRPTGVRNLTVNNTETAFWEYCTGFAPLAGCVTSPAQETRTFFPAVYYRYDGIGAMMNRASYTRVDIVPAVATYAGDGRENRTDAGCAAGVCTYAAEIQNFANWYTYYRSRMLTSQGAVGIAFAQQPESMRVGFASINKGSESIDGVTTSVVRAGVRPFSGAGRNGFFDSLYNGNWPTAGTPLRFALDSVGQYFSRTDARSPWAAAPEGGNAADSNPETHLSCRQSYNILMTDGYRNGPAAPTVAAQANVDGTAGTTINGQTQAGAPLTFTYAPTSPYTDDTASTLADVAMYYWKNDLRTDLTNRVPTSDLNPAFWQHMVTFGVGLGVTGSVDPTTAFSAITDTQLAVTWPAPTNNPALIDDLLHAGVNSRGGFFSATDPQSFADRLTETLEAIVSRAAASGAAAAASSAILQSDTLLYAASFNSNDWSGNLRATQLEPSGALGTVTWDAQRLLSTRSVASRTLTTHLPGTSAVVGTGIPLQWSSLSSAQQSALAVNPPGVPATVATGQDRLNWLRGADSPGLRSRAVTERLGDPPVMRRLGDLVSSDPLLMSKTDYGYGAYLPGLEGSSYQTFRNLASYRARPDALFVGSNGGMLHAFHAGTPFLANPGGANLPGVPNPLGGRELFAYVPSELLLPVAGGSSTHAQINELMRPDYRSNRRYFVDGIPTVTDAYTGPVGSKSWKSVLVGSMGAGGRTVFALDVTDPTSFSASRVLWEFGYAPVPCAQGVRSGCEDMGYGITQPKVVRLRDGTWAAVFGNGYNSAPNRQEATTRFRAKLMMVDLSTGALIHALDTGVGSATAPNGLAPPEVTDWPSADILASRVYAGDLLGNLWRFDLTNPASPQTTRLFNGSAARPITAKPGVAVDPEAPNRAVVVVGTGSYFRTGDGGTGGTAQSIYGFYDSASANSTTIPIDRSDDLLQQTITSNADAVTLGSTTYAIGQLRNVSQNIVGPSQRGWFIDLPAPGELVWREAVFVEGTGRSRTRVSTLVPEPDPCGNGRSGFRMDIDLLSGGAYVGQVWDLNGDGRFTGADGGYSGIARGTGEPQVGIRVSDRSADKNYAGDGTPEPDSRNQLGPAGRQSWRQLR